MIHATNTGYPVTNAGRNTRTQRGINTFIVNCDVILAWKEPRGVSLISIVPASPDMLETRQNKRRTRNGGDSHNCQFVIKRFTG
jgi:hypothetical protein